MSSKQTQNNTITYIDNTLKDLAGLLLKLDPKIAKDPLRITNSVFAENYRIASKEIKELISWLEMQPLNDEQLQKFNAAYQWFNFCTEIYEAFIADPATMALQPDFVFLEHTLHDEIKNSDVKSFMQQTWNQYIPGSPLSYADCYATLCHTMGDENKYAQGFIREIAGELTDKVLPAVRLEYLMSHFPLQMEAFLHQNAVLDYYQKYWFDKGYNPEHLKNKLNWNG
jgi:hypothetical protein